jgi:hypothetical protein
MREVAATIASFRGGHLATRLATSIASTAGVTARQFVRAAAQSPNADRPATVVGHEMKPSFQRPLARRRTCHWNGRRLAALAAAAHRQRSANRRTAGVCPIMRWSQQRQEMGALHG